VTLNENEENKPWWESELPAIREELSVYLRSHVPIFRNDHDDLLNDTLLALTQYIRGGSLGVPQSWSNDKRPVRDERSHLHKVAIVILKRRIADKFRGTLARQSQSLNALNDDVLDSEAVGPERRLISKERQLSVRRLLAVVRSALDQMPPEDRDLIALISQGVAPRAALSDRDRQRLSRIRKRLRTHIARRLGYEVADLLKADD
jgi:DNA-directed RNA polymerase specialized sigma24 family protein